MALRILITPSGFKEGLSADEVASCIEVGVRAALPTAKTLKIPLADGGEGFTRSLVNATHGVLKSITVSGPLGDPVTANWGILGDGGEHTAVLEMASAAGLRLVPKEARDPLRTTTYGVGELIIAALDSGVDRILVGCGDSGTNDGGMGMVQALGGRFLDAVGNELGQGGGQLLNLSHIDLSGLDTRVQNTQIDVACNWRNLLCGSNGVATIFGPQKGASASSVKRLAEGLENYARVIEQELGLDICQMPGSGASGGLGAGLHACLGATLHPWADIVFRYLDFKSHLQNADLVITAEGSIDYQTITGKVPAEVALRAKRLGLPVVVLAGSIGENAAVNLEYGIDAYGSILERPCSLIEAIDEAPDLIAHAAEMLMRLLLVGSKLKME